MALYQVFATCQQFIQGDPVIDSVHIQPVKHVTLNDPIVVFQVPCNGISFQSVLDSMCSLETRYKWDPYAARLKKFNDHVLCCEIARKDDSHVTQ